MVFSSNLKENGNMEAEQYAAIISGITEVKAEQAAQRRELLGNGQPGRIQIIESGMKEQGAEIAGLNKKMYVFTGGLIVASHFLKAAMSKVFGGHWN